MERIALTFLSIAIGAAAIPAVAPAASYDVLVCHAAPGNVNHAFTPVNDNPSRLQAVDNCAVTEDYTGGLYAGDALGSGFTTPEGQQVVWRMSAPSGLKITRFRGFPYLRDLTDSSWTSFFRTTDGTDLLTCKATGGSNCEAGYFYYAAADYPGVDWSMNTDAVEFGSRCDVGSITCGNGALLIRALATFFGGRVTITDNGLPTVANVAGTLLAGGRLSGSKTVTFDASDASGVSAVRLYVDGGQVQASSLTCDFTYAKPCQDVTGRSFTVDTSTLADGPHTVAVGALDAAGNLRQTSTTSFTTNNTPVTPPPSGGGGGGGGTPKPTDAIPAPAPTPEPTPTPPAPAPTPTPTPAPPGTPAPVDAAAQLGRPRWHGSTLSVAGKLSRLATGSVKATLSARVHGRTYKVTRSGRIRSGRWTVNLRTSGRLAKARRLSLRVSYAGNSRVKKTTLRRTISRR